MLSAFTDQGVVYQPHTFELPLNHNDTKSSTLTVYAREVVLIDKQDSKLPWLVYFQGGPGFPSPRADAQSGWLKAALKQYRVLLLDQRGTGLSSPITHQTLEGMTPEQQCEYLTHFRADSIVNDAEAIRLHFNVEKWAILGQSFGGFCSLTYLSLFPNSLLRSYITGGIPSLTKHADDVYKATYQRVKQKNHAFFTQFPQAQLLCQRIADHLSQHHVELPNGQPFTVEQFQMIGINLGRGSAALPMYYLLESAFVEIDSKPQLSYAFLNAMLAEQAYQTNPIYAILHESIYCQPFAKNEVNKTQSLWAAHRIRDSYPEFNYQIGQPFYFTGEMVYPWMFEQMECLKPLKHASQLLAEKSDWTRLYDIEQLENNIVPIACVVYVEDMYVEFDYSRQTLANIPNSKAWMTNEYEHNGIGVNGERIFEKLDDMLNQIQQLPSFDSMIETKD
ncbi:alpha/beta fold hydrolase [Vibrio rumoiensis]|uniref:Alpha/beta hydrolase n=1 Tax=Vibrio rumoiensis 1S-45 TaxID=1188252 RepID=A0A1E5E499_9VIBR|nr:alpha/beta fold hydrolase [Vibrio rumoiensis]OEF27566.1 alpha/beta hydrolase [Vibrio rumoiensis 1S-45]